MKRGQMEMVGLVFVVLIIVLGIFLYLHFSSVAGTRTVSSATNARQSQTYNSFITAFGEAEVPRCGVSAARVAQACLREQQGFDDGLCDSRACAALQDAMTTAAKGTLDVQGISYNFSLEGTAITVRNPCNSTTARSVRTASLPVGSGMLKLSICQ